MSARMPKPVVLVLSLAWVASACGDTFDRPSEILDLRVLGLRAEPPEIVLPTGGAYGLSEVSALVVGGEGEVSYQWQLCVVPGIPTQGYQCPDEAASFDLGAQPTASVLVPSLDDVIASPELEALHVDLSGGFDLTVRLTVHDETDKIVQAVKALSLAPEGTALNTNPGLDGVAWRVDGSKEEHVELLADDEPLAISFEDALELLPSAADGSIETYEGPFGTIEEDLLFSWFADEGEFEKDRSSGTVPENVWSPPELDDDEDERPVRLWLVLRDGRGGIDWLERQLLVKREL